MKCLTKFCDLYKAAVKRCMQGWCPCIYRFFRSKDNEYQIIKGLFGLILGAGVGAALHFVVLVKIEHIPKAYQYHVAGAVMAVFGLACSLSVSARCILVLIFPNFFGKNGRNTVTTFAIMYLMTGPASNIIANAEESARAISCTAALSFNHSKTAFELMHKPLVAAFRDMQKNTKEVKQVTSGLRANFKVMSKDLKPPNLPPPPPPDEPVKSSSPRASKIQIDFSKRMSSKCDEVFEGAVERCKDMFRNTERKCYDKLKFPGVKHVLCLPLKLNFVCSIIRAYKSSTCRSFNPNIDPQLGNTYVKMERLVDSFDSKYHIETQWQMITFPLDMDKNSAKNIQKAVLEEFNRKKMIFITFFFIAQVMLSFTFVLVFVSAFKYNKLFLSDFTFDNNYLTSYFRRIDERRRKKKKRTLLPLMKAEKKEYIEPFHFKMRKEEKSKCIKTVLRLGAQVLATIAIVCFDSLLYEMLDIIRRHSRLEVKLKGHHQVSLKVLGNGLVANLFKNLIGSFDQSQSVDTISSNSNCLPIPTKTPKNIIHNIFLIWLCVFLLVYFEAFSLRLRRTICAFFHRKREKKRVLFMYNDLLKKRKGFLKFMRKRVKRQAKEDKLSRETGILTILRRRFKWIGVCLKKLNLGRQSCLICGELERKGFYHCTGKDCYFSYCKDCWRDVNKRCYACYTGKESDSESSLTDMDDFF
ncbi:E3 ubiquitin-protein ligase DCST1-like [Antedon mediterranea]|uniref:E3 ubiquitin-protein ligase DCST1-like n=1 Tax=Antedon mediterranea TaxID=105859 RepID=UPI003AF9DE2B